MSNPVYYCYIDGSCGPSNPGGTAKFGVLVLDENMIKTYSYHGVVGSGPVMSNNVAEYAALIHLLDWLATNPNFDIAAVHSDSALLVNQIQGKWKCREGLYVEYYKIAREKYVPMAPKLVFIWIPREENKIADNLSKL